MFSLLTLLLIFVPKMPLKPLQLLFCRLLSTEWMSICVSVFGDDSSPAVLSVREQMHAIF